MHRPYARPRRALRWEDYRPADAELLIIIVDLIRSLDFTAR